LLYTSFMIDIIHYSLIKYNSINITVLEVIIIASAFVFTRLFLFASKMVFQRRAKRKGFDYLNHYHSIYLLYSYVVWLLYVYFSLSFIGINLTIFIASSAALFVGIGLGLQQTFNDFISGIIILFEGTLRVGDVVELDARVVKVEEINLRTSRVINRDEISVIIPNSKFVADNVINWTHGGEIPRFNVQVGVDYHSDPRTVERVLIETVKTHHDIVVDAKHRLFVRFLDFGESSLIFQVFFHSPNAFRIEVTKSDLRFMIFEAFKKEGIKIPYPQRDIHVYQKGDYNGNS
jgi:small-conductance mechanosensitive channel